MTSEILGALNPGLIIVLGALLVPFLPNPVRAVYMLALPVVAFVHLAGLPAGELAQIRLFDLELVTTRVDKLSFLFAAAFLIATFLAVLYALHVEGWVELVAGLLYAGSAVGAVLAGDLITLFIFFEMTAISSVFLIWSRGTPEAQAAGLRYLIIQIGSGVILLAGILFHYRDTGGIAFGPMSVETTAGLLVLIALAIKGAFPLLHTWVKDAYPAATVSGTVILSAFTTKLAIYALARSYAGTEILIAIGSVMAVFPILYAIVANDLRRVLAYALIGQLGIMVVGVGIGSDLAVNGAVAHATAGIFYFALLFMAMGAVLHRTGTAKASELGGLYRSMPYTAAFAILGALSIAAAPLFAGFVSKSLVLSAAGKAGLFWPWLAMLVASGAVVVHTAAKVPYFAFFGADSGKRCEEAPFHMIAAMSLAAGMCLAAGLFPSTLYGLLPHSVKYEPYTVDHIVTQLQLLAFALLAFVILVKMGVYPIASRSIVLDTDWFYRRPGHALAAFANRFRVYTWEWLADGIVRGAVKAHDVMERWAGPEGVFGRAWPTGKMAFWTTVMLGAVVIAGFLKLQA